MSPHVHMTVGDSVGAFGKHGVFHGRPAMWNLRCSDAYPGLSFRRLPPTIRRCLSLHRRRASANRAPFVVGAYTPLSRDISRRRPKICSRTPAASGGKSITSLSASAAQQSNLCNSAICPAL